MFEEVSSTDRAIRLPPPYTLVVTDGVEDACTHAHALAERNGAGTLVWARRNDLADFAVVLEPDMSLSHARLAHYAGMNALADALATHAPPSRPVAFEWPDAIRIDGVLVGGGRLSWPAQTDETEVPAWLIFSAMIRLTVVQGRESGLRPQFGALDELGFEVTDASVIISSFSHHLMAGFHEWQEIGAGPLARRWLDRFSSREGMAHFNDTGDLLVGAESSAANLAPRSLAQALLSSSWTDPATGMPWL
ncbi:biotin/lipoate--protein ligase family protein [Pseudorhizobium flavum]|jgi:hypothetical protein|uniref:BPL/LPL catalytic domain-containing protein n=1 Tax=Pseudorhizobium flavum TaxID=1335061 RepID=A0A7X0DFW4_9HYPH|nr:biotin/lipoate--protein ligase family protein [Pseudorhizobium flavum]MBB6181594.1 hypothetical protein [Pseudorhizobium flavum]CAD6619708.1 hypothetical protein RFYW14_03869 [Pseudorhizobium flavum]